AIVVFVRVGFFSAESLAVRQENRFEPAMRAEASIKRMVRRVADENGIVGAHGEKRRVAVNQRAAKTLVNTGLATHAAIGIIGGVKGVMRLCDIVCEDGRIEPCLVPFSGFKGFGKFLTVHAYLPRQKAVGIQFQFAKFRDGRFVAAWQSFKGKAAVFVQRYELTPLFSGILRKRVERVGHVLLERTAAGFKKGANVRGQRIHGFVGEGPVGFPAPGRGLLRMEQRGREKPESQAHSPKLLLVTPPLHSRILYAWFARRSVLRFRP